MAPTPPAPLPSAPSKPTLAPPEPPAITLMVSVADEPIPVALALALKSVAPSQADVSAEAAYQEAMAEYAIAAAEHGTLAADHEAAMGQYEADRAAYEEAQKEYDEVLMPAYTADLQLFESEQAATANDSRASRRRGMPVDPEAAARAYEAAVREMEVREIEVQTDLTTLDMDNPPASPAAPAPLTFRLDIQLSPSRGDLRHPRPLPPRTLPLRDDDETSSIFGAPAPAPAVGPYIPYPMPYPGVDAPLADEDGMQFDFDNDSDPFPPPRPGMPRLAALDAPSPPADFEQAVPQQHWKKLRNAGPKLHSQGLEQAAAPHRWKKLREAGAKPQPQHKHWKKLRGSTSLPALKQLPRQRPPPREPPLKLLDYDESSIDAAGAGAEPGVAADAGRRGLPRSLQRGVNSVRTLQALRDETRLGRRRPSREADAMIHDAGGAEASDADGGTPLHELQGLSDSCTSSIPALDQAGRPSTAQAAYQGMHHVSAYSMWVVKPKVCTRNHEGLPIWSVALPYATMRTRTHRAHSLFRATASEQASRLHSCARSPPFLCPFPLSVHAAKLPARHPLALRSSGVGGGHEANLDLGWRCKSGRWLARRRGRRR